MTFGRNDDKEFLNCFIDITEQPRKERQIACMNCFEEFSGANSWILWDHVGIRNVHIRDTCELCGQQDSHVAFLVSCSHCDKKIENAKQLHSHAALCHTTDVNRELEALRKQLAEITDWLVSSSDCMSWPGNWAAEAKDMFDKHAAHNDNSQ